MKLPLTNAARGYVSPLRTRFTLASQAIPAYPAPAMSATQHDQQKQFTTVVADTGDFESMKAYQPQDATTNPSLILQASEKPAYKHLVDKAVAEHKGSSLSGQALIDSVLDRILILFGLEILKIVPGRVNTAVDINAALKGAAGGPMKGVLATTTDPVVSSDLNHIAASSTVALPQTQVIEGKLVRVLAWYDNEWGFATRMSDTALAMSKLL